MKYALSLFALMCVPVTNTQIHALQAVKKAVIPSAGLGTRFLPFTKATPKELLPILNKPAIDYIARECLNSGIEHMVFITSRNKESLAHYLDHDAGLEQFLKQNKKDHLLHSLNEVINQLHCNYIRQPKPLGSGHAVYLARMAIGNEPFAVLLPDDILDAQTPGIQQLITVAQRYQASVVGVQDVPLSTVSAYGVVAPMRELEPGLFELSDIIEKPSEEEAPSNLAVIGRYVFEPTIFSMLEHIRPGKSDEYQLTDAIRIMIKEGHRVLGYKMQGNRYDIGTPKGWLEANLAYALKQESYAAMIQHIVTVETRPAHAAAQTN